MAEIDRVFFVPAIESIKVDVEMLDYGYIETCNDWKVLYRILQELRSGKEGYYPDVRQSDPDQLCHDGLSSYPTVFSMNNMQ